MLVDWCTVHTDPILHVCWQRTIRNFLEAYDEVAGYLVTLPFTWIYEIHIPNEVPTYRKGNLSAL